MNITITFRHMVGTDAVKNYAYEKIAKLQKFLRQAMTAQVTLSVEGLEHVVEVALAAGSAHFHATERSEDMYASIDMLHDKLERQIRAAKGASVAKKRHGTKAGEFAASVVNGSSHAAAKPSVERHSEPEAETSPRTRS